MIMSEQRTVTALIPKGYENCESERQIRIAAYCRVSTTSQEQEHSFAAQLKYYSEMIGKIPNGILADIYADEGISGRGIGKREEFNRLISDCRKGKIDRIITKSVSRFSRNLTDCLQTVRILSGMGVSILFEKEQIDTATMSSEVLLAMSGIQAQDESISHGNNIRWSYEKRMKNGEFLGCRSTYGYDLIDCATAVINEKEAKNVRLIAELYLSGMGMQKIADHLNENGITFRNGKKWNIFRVRYILNNERYIGDALLQKTITTKELSPRKIKNNGSQPQYYVENCLPEILTKEQRTAILSLMGKRKKSNCAGKTYPLSKMLRCPECGQTFRRVVRKSGNVWQCISRTNGRSSCLLRTVREDDVCEALLRSVNKLYQNRESLLLPLISRMEKLQTKISGSEMKIYNLNSEIAALSKQILLISELLSQGILDPADFALKKNELESRIGELRILKSKVLKRNNSDNQLKELERLNETISSLDSELSVYDENLIRNVITYVTVQSDSEILIHFNGDLTVTEFLPEYHRKRRKTVC